MQKKEQNNEFNKNFSFEFMDSIKNDKFILYLLPRYNTKLNVLNDAEVVVRWNHPTLGLLEPKDFMPQCLEENLLSVLDCYIWEQSCKVLSKWKKIGNEKSTLAIKISSASLIDSKTTNKLLELVKKYQIHEHQLQIEIEEEYINTDLPKATEIIELFRKKGFQIIIDDSKHGCSSLSTLNQLIVDGYKIDMKFFFSGNKKNNGKIILASLIQTLNRIKIPVIAERVETKDENDFSIGCGCNYIQGFFYSKPIPVIDFELKFLHYSVTENFTQKETEKDISSKLPTILVIDDMEMERILVDRYLRNQFNVVSCGSVAEAIRYLTKNKNHIDIILVDYIMPGMNGIEFLQYCLWNDDLRNIPKIMISSNEGAEDQVIAFQTGAWDYITKPLVPELVRIRIENTMALKRKLQHTELENKELLHQTQIDKATGLLNKTCFQTYVENFISKHKDQTSILMILDIDDFKNINDSFGHLTGDKIIKLISHELQDFFRNTDFIGRFGGDEFTVFMIGNMRRDLVESKATELINSIIHESTKEFGFSTSVSIGICFSRENENFKDLFERADIALYNAKKNGKGKFSSTI